MSQITVVDARTAGISGDMLLGALIDAGADLGKIEEICSLVPKHYARCQSLRIESVETREHGFKSHLVKFAIAEKNHETPATEITAAAERIADASGLTERAKSFATASIKTLVEAESKLHGSQLSQTHLHEAGSADTLADVFGAAAACDSLNMFDGEIVGTQVAVGSGLIGFSHGKVTIPPPAVLEVVREYSIPIIGGSEEAELATPTGVCMLANLTTKFVNSYPSMIPERVGYGSGSKKLENSPNLLRVVMGRSFEGQLAGFESIQVLETNLDDLPGEILGHALQQILDSGAKDAWVTPATFKKGRPGHVLHAICDPEEADRITEVMIKETGTLGVRFQLWNRYALQRTVETVRIAIGGRDFDVRLKFAKDSQARTVRVKPEFEDIRSIATTLSMPAREVSEIILHRVAKGEAEKLVKS